MTCSYLNVLLVRVPVLSKQTHSTAPAQLTRPVSDTCIFFSSSLRIAIAVATIKQVNKDGGTAIVKASKYFMTNSLLDAPRSFRLSAEKRQYHENFRERINLTQTTQTMTYLPMRTIWSSILRGIQ